jgi:hypothetical protein
VFVFSKFTSTALLGALAECIASSMHGQPHPPCGWWHVVHISDEMEECRVSTEASVVRCCGQHGKMEGGLLSVRLLVRANVTCVCPESNPSNKRQSGPATMPNLQNRFADGKSFPPTNSPITCSCAMAPHPPHLPTRWLSPRAELDENFGVAKTNTTKMCALVHRPQHSGKTPFTHQLLLAHVHTPVKSFSLPLFVFVHQQGRRWSAATRRLGSEPPTQTPLHSQN